LTTTHIQNFYADKLKDGYSAKTIALMHSTLRKALDSAVRDGMVARNVAALVTPPRLTSFDAHILSVEEARRLIDTARGSRLEALIILAITTGLRKGELLALRWQDVDLQEGVLYVRRTVNRYGKYGMIVSEPKTKSSRRRIVLAEIAVNALKVHYEVQKQRKEAARDIWEENNLVFCNRSGKYLLPETFHKQFKNLLRKGGLPDIRLHDLRHSAASLLLAMGVHPKVVQELLGHSSISTTLDVYSHVIPSLQREASEKMHNLLQIQDESVGKDEI
jgi:integrase